VNSNDNTGEHSAEQLCWKVVMEVENATHKPEWHIVQQPAKHQPGTHG